MFFVLLCFFVVLISWWGSGLAFGGTVVFLPLAGTAEQVSQDKWNAEQHDQRGGEVKQHPSQQGGQGLHGGVDRMNGQ